ncbi:MAG: hypothetical protein HYR85_18220 [Planctomycetes bacterium]|nr:hypothetical protein [Planctomycetota bacterium]
MLQDEDSPFALGFGRNYLTNPTILTRQASSLPSTRLAIGRNIPTNLTILTDGAGVIQGMGDREEGGLS